MKKNVGKADQVIRLVIAAVAAGLLLSGTVAINSLAGIIMAVAGGVALLTGAVSWCGLYALIGASTCPVEQAK